jgi:hypothetical protein
VAETLLELLGQPELLVLVGVRGVYRAGAGRGVVGTGGYMRGDRPAGAQQSQDLKFSRFGLSVPMDEVVANEIAELFGDVAVVSLGVGGFPFGHCRRSKYI